MTARVCQFKAQEQSLQETDVDIKRTAEKDGEKSHKREKTEQYYVDIKKNKYVCETTWTLVHQLFAQAQ